MSSRPSWALCVMLAGLVGVAACKNDKGPGDVPKDDAAGSPGSTPVVEDPGVEPDAKPTIPDSKPEPEAGGEAEPAIDTTTTVVVGDAPCKDDSDCVPATCCHPTACTNPHDAPDCSATSCTMSCEIGTLDCFGGCLCQDGKCAAKQWTPKTSS